MVKVKQTEIIANELEVDITHDREFVPTPSQYVAQARHGHMDHLINNDIELRSINSNASSKRSRNSSVGSNRVHRYTK